MRPERYEMIDWKACSKQLKAKADSAEANETKLVLKLAVAEWELKRMAFLITTVNGFCWGIGLIIAVFLMHYLFHIGICT